jgi:hypothetical protein
MSETTIDKARLTEVLALCTPAGLRDIIASEREKGFAFGMVAEACRDELAKRCERE